MSAGFEVKVQHSGVTYGCLDRLNGNKWLTGTAIAAMMDLFSKRSAAVQGSNQCAFFDPLFLDKVMGPSYSFAVIERWVTEKKMGWDIFDAHQWYLPYNKNGNHWGFFVMDLRKGVVFCYDPYFGKGLKRGGGPADCAIMRPVAVRVLSLFSWRLSDSIRARR
jgi:Ulp1 family protease